LNRKGIVIQTATGPAFMYAGMNRNCFAAAIAGSLH
jgi:hypothetical protein